jgi:hypothetical protein
MMLSTHAIAGGIVAGFFPGDPLLGFAAGFASHFALDALPHWDYKLKSIRKETDPMETDMELGSDFAYDLARISLDMIVGFAGALLFAHVSGVSVLLVLIGAAGGVAPDGLQFVYFKTRTVFLKHLQIFHIWIQKGRSLHVTAWKGMSLQGVLLIILFWAMQGMS